VKKREAKPSGLVGFPERRFRGRSGDILALLAMASLWPERFANGWVWVRHFMEYGLHLQDRTRETVKSAFREAQPRITKDLHLLIRSERTTEPMPGKGERKRKEDMRRIDVVLPRQVREWLFTHGQKHVRKDVWDDFNRFSFRPPETPEEVLWGLQEAEVRGYMGRGLHDRAVHHARRSLRLAHSSRELRPLRTVLAQALLRRRQSGDQTEALALLTDLAQEGPAPRNAADTLSIARAKFTLVAALFYQHIEPNRKGTPRLQQLMTKCQAMLDDVEQAVKDSLADYGHLLAARASLARYQALWSRAKSEQERLFDLADALLRHAFEQFRIDQNSYGLTLVLSGFGTLERDRYLAGVGDSIEVLRRALTWYEASIKFRTITREHEWMVDLLQVAEVTALLLPYLTESGARVEALRRAARAERYLVLADKAITRGTNLRGRWQKAVAGLRKATEELPHSAERPRRPRTKTT
jgi:hypothetical protein